MKKNILFLTLIAVSASLFSQITLNRGHLAVSGQKIIQGYDTLGHSLAASGTNMTWDFTGLKAHTQDSMRFGREFWYEGYTYFPKANMGQVYYDDESTTTFLSINDNDVTIYGAYDKFQAEAYTFESRIITFPSTYNTTFSNPTTVIGQTSMPVGMDPDSSGPLPTIDSIRFGFTNTSSSKIDGWGTMKTPLGNFQALKQTTLTINGAKVEMYVNGIWMAVPEAILQLMEIDVPTADTSYDVNFWTNDAKVGFPLVNYSYGPGETTTDEVTWNMAMAKGSSINSVYNSKNGSAYPNPVKDQLVVKSNSDDAVARVYDMNGQLIIEKTIGKQGELSFVDLNSGLYLLQISDAANHIIHTQKVVKQ